MLNPLWLNTFKTLVEVGHFTKTASKLHMTQPGVSQHLKKLEQACGHVLVKRDSKHLELTEQGRQVYEYTCQQQKAEADFIDALSFDDPHKGVCKLACSGAFALRLYPELLALQRHAPERRFELEVAPTAKILANIQTGAIDIGILTQAPSSSLFTVEELGNEQLCLLVPKTFHSTLYSDNNKASLTEALVELGLVQHPDALHYLALYLERCNMPDLKELNIAKLPSAGYINQLNLILQPVAAGLGFTVLPLSAWQAFPDKHLVEELTPNQPVYETLYAAFAKHRTLPKRYNDVITTIRKVSG